MRGHGHGAAVRQHEPRAVTELLDEAEDVVPAPAVEPHDVVAQFMEDLVDLECGGDGLDEDRDLDRPARQPEHALGVRDDLGPESRLEAVLEFRQVEVRSRASAQELGGVVVQVQAEIHERAGDRLVAVQPVLFGQVPAARPHHEHRGLFVEPVGLAFGGRVREVAAHRVASGWLDPRSRLAQVGHNESSKSAMKTFAPELSALMTILRSGGPVISTRRSRRSCGIAATRHSAARSARVSCREVRQLAGVEFALLRRAPGEQARALAPRNAPRGRSRTRSLPASAPRAIPAPWRQARRRPAFSDFSCSTRNYLKMRYLRVQHAGARSTSRVRAPARS